MSSFSEGLNLPFIISGAAGGIITNEAFLMIDTILGRGVESIVDDEPSGVSNGEAYIIRSPTVNDPFDGHDGEIALRINSAWRFIPVQQGCRTYVRDLNVSAVKGGGDSWIATVGEAMFFARLASDQTLTSTSWDQIEGWTQTQEPGTNDVYDHNPFGTNAGQVQVKMPGKYLVTFSGSATPITSLSTFELGVAHTTATAEAPTRLLENSPLNVPVQFHSELLWVAGTDDVFSVSGRRTSGAGGLRFEGGYCSWSMRLISA